MKKTLFLISLLVTLSVSLATADNGQERELFVCVSKQDEATLGQLLRDPHINVNYRNNEDRSVLMEACSQQWYAGVKLLIESGRLNAAYKNPAGMNALMFAARDCKNDSIVRLIISRGDSNINNSDAAGKTVLMYAIDNRNSDVFNFLMGQTINFEAEDNEGDTAILYAMKKQKADCVKKILLKKSDAWQVKSTSGFNALKFACESRYIAGVRAVVDSVGFDPQGDCNGEPALITLIRTRMPFDIIKKVISGIPSDTFIGIQDQYGQDVKYWAEEVDDERTLELVEEKIKKAKRRR